MWRPLGLGELSKTSRALVCEGSGLFSYSSFSQLALAIPLASGIRGNHILGYKHQWDIAFRIYSSRQDGWRKRKSLVGGSVYWEDNF